MKKFKKIYIEITNICNLNCSFCKKPNRARQFMQPEYFEQIIGKIEYATEYIYLHVCGEPLLHPQLGRILDICGSHNIKANITTNGTLIGEKAELLLAKKPRQINFSLHDVCNFQHENYMRGYLENILNFSKAASKNTYINLRLWNAASEDEEKNAEVIGEIAAFFRCGEIKPVPGHSVTLSHNIYLQVQNRFTWPDANLIGNEIFTTGNCYGLSGHIGILADGTVVPCCLDWDGYLGLGNILTEELEDILSRERAVNIRQGFRQKRVTEPFCRTCGFSGAKI